MEIKEIKCKNCMTKSKLSDYVINPYTGCEHACIYCYADFIKRFQNIDEKWGDFLYAKMNCPELLEKELEKNKPGHIWISSVCDCYTPSESKFMLTRKILETISDSKFKNKFSVEILTKSSLVRRDFDLLKKLDAELGMSINSLDEKFSRLIEPLASSPQSRIETLKLAKENGIKVFGFISPVTIFTDFEKLFRELRFCDYVWIEILNIKPSVQQRMIPLIKEKFPERLDEFMGMIHNYEKFYEKIKKQSIELQEKYNLKVMDVVVHF